MSGRRFSRAAAVAALMSMATAAACSHGRSGSPSSSDGSGSASPSPRVFHGSPPPLAPGHPRLWITQADLPRLQAWANPANPVWQSGLAALLEQARQDMDGGKVPPKDCGGRYEDYPTESYAEVFAFDGLIDVDPGARADSMERAHALLMDVMDQAAKGPAAKENVQCGGNQVYPRFRDPTFATDDRARYYGQAFPLIVDWIYPTLSAADKAKIRAVFLRWAGEIEHQGYHHPQPVGAHLDPALLADRSQVRWAGNNYFTGLMRNLGMQAMALDPADDTGGRLHSYLTDATKTWLYLFDNLTRTDARGGALPEGFEYSPQTAAYAAQFLLALRSAGEDDPARNGPAVVERDNPFWDDFIAEYAHALSPAAVTYPDQDLGPVHQPAAYGDLQKYWAPDFVAALGPLGILHQLRGDKIRTDAVRWLAINLAPGGPGRLFQRISNPENFVDSILYFLLLDPAAPPAADPRPGFGLSHLASGTGRLSARTGWDERASWLTFALSWNAIDHQNADGLDFGLYRHGEWLTKQHTGYGDEPDGISTTEWTNSLAVHNDRPRGRSPGDWEYDAWQRGSQWNLEPSADPPPPTIDTQSDFIYALGDATGLYNSTDEEVAGVTGVSRSIVWLKPDRVVVYDRVDTNGPKGFKRWWLQVPAPAQADGPRAVVTTPRGQELVVTTLLPAGATPRAVNNTEKSVQNATAEDEPMKDRILVAAPGDPASARFLNVLQGADPGGPLDTPPLLTSADGAWQGTVADGTAVCFPVNLGQRGSFTITVPTTAKRVLVTGLASTAGYAVNVGHSDAGTSLSVDPGGARLTDSGGVLDLALA